MGQLQWDRLHRFQLMKNDRNQVHLPLHAFSQRAQRTCVYNQLFEQGGNVDHATISWKPPCKPWFQIQRSHRDRARHRDNVRYSGRNPHCTVGRYNPGSVSSPYRHHAARGINELIPIMEVQRDNVSGWIVAGESCNRRFAIARPVENPRLAHLRHRLSPYRKHVELAIASIKPGWKELRI